METKTKKLPEQKEPYELFIKLQDGEAKTSAYVCGICHIPTSTYESAKRCCEHHFCKQCGKDLGIKNYYAFCNDCIEKNRFEQSETVQTTELPVSDDGELYFETISDAIDHYCDSFENDPESVPEYLWVCEINKWDGINIDNVIESEMEDHHEDAGDQIAEYEEIRVFIKEWNAKQNVESWNVRYKQKINLHELLKK